MTQPPARPKIYHITHVDNLVSIVHDRFLLSDAGMIAKGGPSASVGMSTIKKRRLEELEVTCHPGTKVGEYVPFYFCPRSIMLSTFYYSNLPDLDYRGGQEPIIHIESDLHDAVAWADDVDRRWAISLSSAGARYAPFRASLDALNEIDWSAVRATDFRAPEVKEGKQAEFLLHETFPLELVARVGVKSAQVQADVESVLAQVDLPIGVEVQRDWYYYSKEFPT